jgi:signal transduction histidine kinase
VQVCVKFFRGRRDKIMDERDSLIDLLIHDLTGPLTIASTSASNLLNKEDRYGHLNERQRKSLNMVLRNTKKAQSFLQEIIEVYRSEEGLFRKEQCSVPQILRDSLSEAIEMFNPDILDELLSADSNDDFFKILKNNGVFVLIEGKYSSTPFIHDQKKIQQIIRNLITNALKYRRKHVSISISGDEDLVIMVEDDGSGIPPEKQEYIFKRFLCAKDKPKGDERGLGFGLSCVKTLIDTIKGRITVTSGEGKGTCFTVRIPPLQA